MNKRRRKFKKKFVVIPLISLIVVGTITSLVVAKKHSDSMVKVVPVSELGQMYSSDNLGIIYSFGTLQKGSVQNVIIDDELSIKKINVEKGDTVNKGDTLIEYDTEILQLNAEAKQTEIDILANDIKIAENELATIKGLIPSENAPVVEKPTEPPKNDIIIEDIIPEIVEYEKEITKKTAPLAGDGSESSPFIFNVGEETVVKKDYMQYLYGATVADTATKPTNPTESTTENVTGKATEAPTSKPVRNSKYAMFHIYNEAGVLLYSWLVDGARLTADDITDWQCSNGVVISEDGNIFVKQGTNLFATLVTYSNDNTDITDEQISVDDLYAEYLAGNVDIPEEYQNMQNQAMPDSDGSMPYENYMYTKAELQDMISAKQAEVDELKFSKRQAEIDLRNAKKLLERGNEIANIGGTVTFVAKSAEEAIVKGAYITIINDSITNVVGSVSENDLPYVELDMVVEVTNSDSRGRCTGRITNISKEALQGGYDMYGSYDDTVSYYEITVELNDKIDINEKDTIFMEIKTNDAEDCVWVESAFIRSENGKNYVMVANENNVIEKRYVEVGRRFYDVSVEVKSGLSSNDRIALPYGKTKEGMPAVDATYAQIESGFMF